MALYGDEENPVQWYRAVVDRVITKDDVTGEHFKFPKFVVTFPEYGNTETVSLGELDELDGNWHKDRLADPGRPRHRNEESLYDEVRRRERDETVSGGRKYGNHPTKANLTTFNGSQRDNSQWEAEAHYSRTLNLRNVHRNDPPGGSEPMTKKRTAEAQAATTEKKRRLLQKYG